MSSLFQIPGTPEHKLIPPDDFMMNKNSRRYFLLMAAKNKGRWIIPLVSEIAEEAVQEAKKKKQQDPLTVLCEPFENGWGRWPDLNDCITLYYKTMCAQSI